MDGTCKGGIMKILIAPLVVFAFMACFLPTPPANARTWHILPDGSGDAPTIQAGIDSAVVGDIVEVACGTYFDCTHEDPYGYLCCVILKSGIVLRSETGTADCVTIDAQELGRVIFCEGVDNTTVIEGFRLTNGYTNLGGGLVCLNSNPLVRYCVFANNRAHGDSEMGLGGGMCCIESSPSVSYCEFTGNEALNNDGSGGGFLTWFGDPILSNCLVSGNGAAGGGGVGVLGGSLSVIDCTITTNDAGNRGGGVAVFGGGGFLTTLTCFNTDIRDNTALLGPDGLLWVDSNAVLTCCDIDESQWYVEASGELILDNEGCEVAVQVETWGGVKALYR